MTKPGYMTTEFWLVILANVLTQLKTLPFPAKYNGIVLIATVVGYAISRGLAKIGPSPFSDVPTGDPIDTKGAGDHPEGGLA